jgi:hypothetical protein
MGNGIVKLYLTYSRPMPGRDLCWSGAWVKPCCSAIGADYRKVRSLFGVVCAETMKGSAMNVEVINLATRFINPLSWRPNIWHCLSAAITVGTFMYYLAASKLH